MLERREDWWCLLVCRPEIFYDGFELCFGYSCRITRFYDFPCEIERVGELAELCPHNIRFVEVDHAANFFCALPADANDEQAGGKRIECTGVPDFYGLCGEKSFYVIDAAKGGYSLRLVDEYVS